MKQLLIIIGICTLQWGVHIPHLSAQTYSDTTWERLYFYQNEDEGTFSSNHIETYDKGYLLATYLNQEGAYKPKLYKTDINGYYLWDRMLDTTQFVGTLAMIEDNDGNIYLCGSTFPEDYPNPLVMKLNVCGEVEWCKSFIWNNGSDAVDMQIDHNGDIIILTSDFGNMPSERINLIKLDIDGELIWKKNYATIEEHPWIWNAQGNQLIISESNDYYITGQAWWPTNNDPNQGSGLRSFFVKVAADGKEEWVLPFGIYNGIYGIATKSIQFNDTLFLGVASDWQPEPPTTLFIWYNNEGEVYSYNSKHIEIDEHFSTDIYYPILLENNTLWGIMPYLLSPEETSGHYGYIQLDTSINLINYMEDDRWRGISSLIHTYNNKFVTVAKMREDVPGFIYDVYISKRNEDFSFDTVYSNWPGSYDSLCPHAIESGYLPYECETIIVGTEEVEQKPNQELKIKITPNPAENKVNITFENNNYKELGLQIFNINGKELLSRQLHTYPQSTEIDISKLSKGVYLVAVKNKERIVGREKLVVE